MAVQRRGSERQVAHKWLQMTSGSILLAVLAQGIKYVTNVVTKVAPESQLKSTRNQCAQFAPKTGQLFDVDAEGGLDAQLAALMGAQGGGADAAILAALAPPCAAHAQLGLRASQCFLALVGAMAWLARMRAVEATCPEASHTHRPDSAQHTPSSLPHCKMACTQPLLPRLVHREPEAGPAAQGDSGALWHAGGAWHCSPLWHAGGLRRAGALRHAGALHAASALWHAGTLRHADALRHASALRDARALRHARARGSHAGPGRGRHARPVRRAGAPSRPRAAAQLSGSA